MIPMFFEEKKSRFVTRLLAEISAIWMWVSLMFLIDIVVIYAADYFFNINLSFLLLIVPLSGIYAYYKAHKLVINEKIICLDNLNSDVNIAHLSDVHFGAVRHEEIINQLRDNLMEVSKTCDVAIISGDLADGSSIVDEDDFIPLKDVEMPIIFTPGNHDYYLGIENVIKACKKAGIIVLDNESLEMGDLNIYGLSYSFGDIEMPSLEELKSQVKTDKTNIIIYHNK